VLNIEDEVSTVPSFLFRYFLSNKPPTKPAD